MADQRYQNHPLPPPPPSHSQGNQYSEESSSYDYRYQQPSQPQQQYSEQQYQQPNQQTQQHYQQQQPASPVSPTSYQQVQPPAQAHAAAKQLPGPPQRQHTKQRTFSFQSNKSQKSNGSHHKTDNHETHAEKEAKRLHSKADPTMAISEAEPSAVQAQTKNSLAPLRSIQHRDSYGNAIAEPDRSNPTRSRWERPLDTIRSFEAAIDGGYSRKSFIRQDSDNASTNWNRRNSYYGSNTARFPQESYYGSRPMSMIRSDSSHMDFARPQRGSLYEGSQANGDSYTHSGNGQGPSYGPGSSRQRTPRMMSEPMPAFREQQQQIYPLPHKDRSYETVTTAAGSGSSDQAGYQTDPTSSDNSSVHRTSPPKRQEPVNDYGIGFNQSSSFQPAGFNMANGARNAGPNGQAQQQQRGPPPPPHGQMAPPQPPPKNGNVLLRKQSSAVSRPEAPEKRKSWFSRRFSKAA